MSYERSRQIEQRFQRAVELITENSHSARHLAEALGVSRPTVHRIIVELKRRGYVIRAVRDEYGWRYECLSGPRSEKSKIDRLIRDETT
jgi:biotin operon repressor